MKQRQPAHLSASNSVASACTGKAGFETYALANAINTRHQKQSNRQRGIYKCSCGLFHLGTPNRIPVRATMGRWKTGGKRHMRHHFEIDEVSE